MKNKKSIEKLRVEFLPEALEIVEKPSTPLGRIIIWMVFGLLITFILWACLGKVDEVTTARGQVVSVEGVQEIQAADTGIITSVNIIEGQSVKKGELLYSIDKEIEESSIEYSEGEVGLIQLKSELIGKLLENKSILSYRNGDYNDEQMQVIESMIAFSESDEISLQGYEQAVDNALIKYNNALINLDINQEEADYLKEQQEIQEQLYGLNNATSLELDMLRKEHQKAVAEAAKYEALYNAGAVSKSEWEEKISEADKLENQIRIKEVELQGNDLAEDSESSSMEYQITQNQSNYMSQKGTLEELKNSYEMAVLNLESAKKQRTNTLYDLKEECDNKLKEYGVTIDQQYYQYEHKDIYAPYDGIIKTVNVKNQGAVVMQSEVLAEIIPQESQLIVEAEVKNKDIGFIEEGQSVDVKVDTYDYQKYGIISGKVVYISPDSIENERLEKVYKVNILLDKTTEENFQLVHGMECSVEIKTNQKRIIAFFLEPLTEALDNSLKER